MGEGTEFVAGLLPENASLPEDITPGPDGNVWFTDANGHAIGRITPSGVITEFTPTRGALSTVVGIAPGADGNMWFTDPGAGKIGRITMGGKITEFNVPPGSSPYEIAPGPDGNMWFADDGYTRAIGRITPDGEVTEFSAGLQPDNSSNPSGIAPGPDGNVWFTDSNLTPAIGRITRAGRITEFTAGLEPQGGPFQIAPGADGNMWFSDSPAVGRITHEGAITLFAPGVPSGYPLPTHIAPGPHGSMWFTSPGQPRSIDEITPDGPTYFFTAGLQPDNGSYPWSIAPGADGNLWFTDQGNTHAIGRIGTGVPSASVLAGEIEALTCKPPVNHAHIKAKRSVTQTCSVKFRYADLTFDPYRTVRASVLRHRVVYATGVAPRVRGGISLLLTPHRLLRPGNYTLRLAHHKPISLTVK